MAVTIEDIAREAGVSIATVSRVINQTKAVSPELKRRVEAAIEKNHFKPNTLARGLVISRTNMVGIIIPDFSNPVFGMLTKGINQVCQENDYTLILCESGGIKKQETELLNRLEERRIDGLFFAGVEILEELACLIRTKAYPCVLVGQEVRSEVPILTTVIQDNEKAVYDGVDFLISNGHRRIAYLSGPIKDYSSGERRLSGYVKAMAEHQLEVPGTGIAYGDFTFESGSRCMQRVYEESSVLPTAVMAANDLMAAGAVRFLENAGQRVPEDISVMGFDDVQAATFLSPGLTTVRIPYYEAGVTAARELFKMIGRGENAKPQIKILPHQVIRRGSVKSCR